MKCPYCGHANIEGAEACDQCHQPLTDLHLPVPATAVERALLKDRVAVLTPKPLLAVSPDTCVSDVLSAMVEKGVGCVLIEDAGQMVGVFSEQDALSRLGTRGAELADEPISNYMTPDPQSLSPGAKVAFAVQRMDLGGYRHLPIATDSKAEGMISVRDILRYLRDKMSS